MERFNEYLGNMDNLLQTSTTSDGKGTYIHPALKNSGVVLLVLIRKAIGPVMIRNSEEEITDIEFNGATYIRAVPNKFKYPERGRGLQILRAFGAGGRLPQNKTALGSQQKPSDAFDMNALVFGDSTTHNNRVLPIKSAVNHSDALSFIPKYLCVDESFHNRAMEDGTLFNAENKKNSDNLFNRHFILPGTLMVQVLSTRGRVLPIEGLNHLLLSMGVAGAYGGQTSITGTNISTIPVGMYGAKFERPETSPYEIVRMFKDMELDATDEKSVIENIHKIMQKVHVKSMSSEDISAYQSDLMDKFEKNDQELKKSYLESALKVGELFDNWFGTGK
ncbi:MAG: hypothetical protein AB7U45_09375 [Desulfamplus sp.]